ncbi:uncharacterized protein LOC116723091 isoform X3 [Xiphophorus hellerii]|uniref:uncharacterized protein LOC116723091 isoform X3 n=1 Tax=Xiphophorus hellerii TaxID=8084 RepID=UPI0013B45CF3|nr:uncharacterized protein LOC116723091 isoform X3 [Xiphophorus hellerii]
MAFFKRLFGFGSPERTVCVSVSPSPPPKAESPTLGEPWRELDWGEKQENLKYVQEYKPEQDDIRFLRVLLYGPVGAGKSSFINSVSNVLRGRMTIPALASATTSDKSFTKKYETHKFNKGRGSAKTFFPLVFNDFMGLEDGTNRGVHADDIKLALEGHLKEGYEFNQVAPISQDDPGYNPTPSADDRVHVLVCVMSANTSQMNSSVLEKMKSVRETARDLGIPQMAMMTRIDEACCETDKDLRIVYKSKYLRKKMKDFSSAVGIPVNCIFPVKNYSEEIDMNDDIDTLILSALRKMVDFGDDFIEKAEMAAVGAEDNNMEVNYSAGEKDHKAASLPEGPKLETALQIYQPGNSHTEHLTPMDTSESPQKKTKQNNESGKETKGSRAEKLMKCPKCKAGISPSVTFCKQKNDQCEFSIGLHQDNGDDHTALFEDKLTFTEQLADIKNSKPCPNCNHSFPVKHSVASRTNTMGGFNIELSINISKEDKLEGETVETSSAMMDNLGMEQDDGDESSSETSTGSNTDDPSLWTTFKNWLPKIPDKLPTLAKPEQSNQTTNSEKRSFSSHFKPPAPVVKVHYTPTSDTFGADTAIIKQLKNNLKSSVQLEKTTRKNCNIIIVFCPVGRNYESEVKSAMEKEAVSSSGKPFILVLMHHTRDPDYSTAGCDVSEVLKNVFYVHVFYHENKPGLLECSQNARAIKVIEDVLLCQT